MLLLKNYTNLYTHPTQSNQIIHIIKSFISNNNNKVIIDANAGMGGDSIFFCKYFKHVYCIEINNECIDYLEHNLNNYNNKDIFNINCIDAFKILQYDVIFGVIFSLFRYYVILYKFRYYFSFQTLRIRTFKRMHFLGEILDLL